MRDTFFCGVPVQTFYSKWTMCRMLLRTYRKSSSVLDTGSWSGAWTAIIFHVLLDWRPFLSMTDLSFYKYALMWTADSLEKSLMLGKTEGRRGRGHQRMRWLDGITDAMDMNLGNLRKMVRGREALCDAGVAKSWTQLGDWRTAACDASSCTSWLWLGAAFPNHPVLAILISVFHGMHHIQHYF